MRRFYLYFPGASIDDFTIQATASWAGVALFSLILVTTFFMGRIWCSSMCPVGGFPEIVSRTLNDRMKIEYRSLPQVGIRYGYFGFYLVMMPMLGISACVLCNFLVLPRIFDALGGSERGYAYLVSAVGMVNFALVCLLGFFANKGRAYCSFLCPIGAVDGLVNRLGASFNFTHRIRVDRDRCNGCSDCAHACMCGAIEMVDEIAVVDQYSCMSCHECVDVCAFGSIEYMAIQPSPKIRSRKLREKLPQPLVWTALAPTRKGRGWKFFHKQRLILFILLIFVSTFIYKTQLQAKVRYIDPDGCMVCHALEGMEFVDNKGVMRSSSSNSSHYYSSLHGSIPCKDCHQKITEFPHKVENGVVDCANTCHLNEPSEEKRYSHKEVVEEFELSSHKKGKSKGFTGGNRLEESVDDLNPSCRTCHSNTLYVEEVKMQEFKKMFKHTETECGVCHQGETWLNQFGGHILRRLLSARWNKLESNQLCLDCHNDQSKMEKVELNYPDTGKKYPAGSHFKLAGESYNMTLHGKMIQSKN
ncbi:MAG: 4Fe-4S binding protein, partial [Proteobacteria bacterium]|nr:4Fe-4S binding protein [Pseudomonadota bacterium]